MDGTALIIDDNPLNAETLSLMLKQEGMPSVILHSPKAISDALNQIGPVRVVFLDLEFPHENGLNVAPELRRDERLAGVPLVAFSVHTSELNEARRAGFHGFLGKPVSVGRFPEQLRRILSGEPVWEVT